MALDDLAERISDNASVRAGAIGETLTAHTETLRSAAAEAFTQLSDVRNAIQRESELLEDATQASTEAISEVAELLRGRREDLAASTAAMRRTAAETGETLSGQGREVRDIVDGLVARWRELGDTLVVRAETLREVGEGAVGRVDATMQSLDRYTGELSGASDRMEHRVDGLRDALREQARDMQSSLDQVSEKAESVAATFRMHERALIEASNEATHKAEELRLAQVESSRGVFLRTVNRVLDTLGSVGVDLDRTFEGTLSPDVIKRFGKGDTMVAVRRVASRAKDPIAMARVRELFEEDDEFRTLAMRYMREHVCDCLARIRPDNPVCSDLCTEALAQFSLQGPRVSVATTRDDQGSSDHTRTQRAFAEHPEELGFETPSPATCIKPSHTHARVERRDEGQRPLLRLRSVYAETSEADFLEQATVAGRSGRGFVFSTCGRCWDGSRFTIS